MAAPSLLEELDSAGRQVAEDVGPSVVGIGRGGSGVVVAPGTVVTNAHNLRHDEVEVVFGDGRQAVGTVTAVDVDGDLAVVAVDTADARPIAWSDEPAAPGTPVFALANPGGRGTRVSFGVVSSVGRSFRGPRGRRITGSVEHTAPLRRGSSGGPLVDVRGRVVGLNTHRLGDGFYLALPADPARRQRLDDLRAGRTPTRRSLGIAVAPPEVARRLRAAVGLPERAGLLVREVDESGPAHGAGVRRGDLLVEVGGRDVTTVDELHDVLDGWAEPAIGMTVVRGAEELPLDVRFPDEGESTSS